MLNKVLITGCRGQLGRELSALLPKAVFADSKTLDITNFAAVQAFVAENKITAIVNCAAYTAVDKAEEEEVVAYQVNAIGPLNLAKTGCKLIHISTDYVFDGNACCPIKPEDNPRPISAYGRTKLAGETFVLAEAECGVVIRTSWLYSTHGSNFVKTIRKLGAERASLGVVADQIGAPTYAGDLASAIVKIIPQLRPDNRGVYHYANEGVCSWYDFAWEIVRLSQLSCKICPIGSLDYPTKAKRPFYSVLDKSKLKETFNLEIQYWKESLEKCLTLF